MTYCICTCIMLGFVSLILATYFYVRYRYLYWDRKTIPYARPTFPMGNMGNVFQTNIPVTLKQIYDKASETGRFIGMFYFMKPAVLILDPELAKHIMIRDFNYFPNRGIYSNEIVDPLSAHLIGLEGYKWKSMRSKLTPMFSSTSIKAMFDTVLRVSEVMQAHVTNDVIDIKDIFSRYTTDVITSCALGAESNSIEDPNTEFYKRVRQIFTPSTGQTLKQFFSNTFNNCAQKFKIKVTDPDVELFFMKKVRDIIDQKRINKEMNSDFLQQLLELQDAAEGLGLESIAQIAAHIYSLYLTGQDATSTTMSCCLYELGRHTDIQETARDEIRRVLKASSGKLTLESLNKLTYLDKIIKETMRIYPTQGYVTRITERDYDVDETKYTIDKGTLVLIPSYALHMDPKHFPEPDTFDPERFSDANILQRHPFSYLPYGDGPRSCIGAHLGRMIMLIGLVRILHKFRVSHCTMTPEDVGFSTPQLEAPFVLKLSAL